MGRKRGREMLRRKAGKSGRRGSDSRLRVCPAKLKEEEGRCQLSRKLRELSC